MNFLLKIGEHFENRFWKYIFFFFVLFLTALIFEGAFVTNIDGDSHMYMAMGRHFFERGWDVFHDHHSIDFQGKLISPNPWLFTLIVGFVHTYLGGMWGLSALRFVIFMIPFLYFAKKIYNDKFLHPFFKILYIITFVTTILIRDQLRPEIVSMFLTLFYTYRCQNILQSKSIKSLDPLIVLLVLWHQLHMSYMMGVTIVGATLIAFTTDAIKNKNWPELKPIAWRIFFVLLTSLIHSNPLDNPILQSLTVHNRFGQFITEFNPNIVFLTDMQVYYWTIMGLSFIYSIYKKNIFAIVVIGVFARTALQIPVVFPYLVTTTIPIVVAAHKDFFASTTKTFLKVGITAILIAGSSWSLTVGIARFINSYDKLSLFNGNPFSSRESFPVDIAEFMNKRKLGGVILNTMQAGSYLSYALEKPSKVFLDIRVNILYPFAHFARFMLLTQSPMHFTKEVDKINPDFIVVQFNKRHINEYALINQKYSALYYEPSHILLEKQNQNSLNQTTDLLFDPACIHRANATEIEKEMKLVSEYEPKSVALTELLTFAELYLKAKNEHKEKEFLEKPVTPMTTDPVVRLYAYLLYQMKDYKKSLFVYQRIHDYYSIDFVDTTDLLLKLGLNEGARDNLVKDTELWSSFTYIPNLKLIKNQLDKLSEIFPDDKNLNQIRMALATDLDKNTSRFESMKEKFRGCRP